MAGEYLVSHKSPSSWQDLSVPESILVIHLLI